MENPWASAWDESHKPQSDSISTTNGSAWALKLENASVNKDHEADIATPSWTSGPAVKWNEPADDSPSLWGTEEKGSWTLGTSSYESIDFGIGNGRSAEVAEVDVPDSSQGSSSPQESEGESDDADETPEELSTQLHSDSPNHEDLTVVGVSQDIDPWTPSRSTFLPSDDTQPSEDEVDEVMPPIIPPGSPDAFGTFETGLPSTKSDADPWSSPRRVSADVGPNEWGAAWAPSDSGEETETKKEPILDEWEAARRQKEIQDKYVPPELLASILKKFEEISSDLWTPAGKSGQREKGTKDVPPGAPSDSDGKSAQSVKDPAPEEKGSPSEHVDDEKVAGSEESEKEDFESEEPDDENVVGSEESEKEDVESEKPDGYSTNISQGHSILRGGMEDVEGMEALSTTIIPPLTLPTLSPFLQSFTCKRTAEAVRLTRNAYITRSGPMAKYLQTKGSIAWEVAVKSRVERNLDEEVLPAGWRIIEKSDKEKELPSPVEMKRKATGGILSSFFGRRAATPPVTGESTQKERSASPRTSISSPRPSIDSAAARNSKTISSSSRDASPAPSVAKSSVPIAADVATISSISAATKASSTSGTTSAATTGYADAGSPDLFQDSSPQPAPSAVSRFFNRFSRNKSSPRNSLALSSDDLEFLSDVVPSVSDDVEEDSEEQLKALSNMIGSAPLPSKLPPPLAPPPRAPPQSGSTSIGGIPPASGDFRPSNATLSQPPLIPSSLIPSPLAPTPVTTSQLLPSPASPLTSPISPVSSTSSSAASSMIAIGGRAGTPSQSSSLAMKGRDKVSSSAYTLPPPHSRVSLSSLNQKRATPVAIMSSTSSRKPVADFPSIGFLPPPPSVPVRPPSSTAASSSLLMDPFELEPGPSSAKIGSPSVPPAQTAGFDDDDFADFHSASFQPIQSSASLQSSSSLYDTSFNSATSDQNLFSGGLSAKSKLEENSTDLFDDFDDFVSSPTLRTPSPPKPPTKSPAKAPPTKSSHPVLQIIPPPFASSSPQPPPAVAPEQEQEQGRAAMHRRKVSREEHRRTQSLIESAAAQKGRWPAALPSPLPPILSPPPGEHPKQGSNGLDIFSDDNSDLISPSLETQQSKAMAGLGLGFPSSVSSPAVLSPAPNAPIASMSIRNGTLPPLPLPPAPQQQQQTSPVLMDLFGSEPVTSSTAISSKASPASTAVKSGGLSAQDLSFFEGL